MKVLQYQNFKVTDEMLASKGSRFGNFIIDRIVSTLFIIALTALFVIVFQAVGYYEGVVWFQEITTFTDYAITITLTLLYYFVLEVFFAKTIGKFITQTSVVLEDGSAPSSSDIIIRTFSRLVPFEPFSFLGEDAYGWHDRWSDTYVVKDTVFKAHKKAFEEYHELGNTTKEDSGYSIENMGIDRN